MSKAVQKNCQICEKSFLARRDAKTCSPTCRKRLERSAKRNLVETKVGQVKDEAKRIETNVQEGLQQIASTLLSEQFAYAGAEGLGLGSTLADEVAADSGGVSSPDVGSPRSIAVTGDESEAQRIAPTVLRSETGSTNQGASTLAGGEETTGKSPIVVSTMPKAGKKPAKGSHRIFHTLRWAALALLLLLGAGVIISLMWGRSNHNQLGQLNNIQQHQSRQELHQQTTINNKISQLEVKVNALDARVSNLKVSSGTGNTTNSSASQALGSDVTLEGNAFNGPNQLVQLTAGGLVPVLNGSNLTVVNAITLQGNPASYYTNASNLNSGTVNDARLSNNVALLNAANTFSQPNTFSSTVVLGMLGGTGSSALCLNGSNQVSACGAGPGTSSLQQTYQASTSPQIVLNAVNGGLVLQDAASAIGGNLFAVQSHGGGATYFAVTASGITTSGTINGNGSGLINLNGANLTAGTVGNAALTNSSLTVTAGTGLGGGGSVALGSSTTLNVAYGSTSGTAVQGNTTLNCPSITGINLTGGGGSVTLGTTGSSCNSIGFTNSPTFSGTLAVQGAGGLTVGSTANTGVLNFLDGTNDGFNASLGLSGALTASQAFLLPATGGTLCTTTTCAAGSGSGYIQLQGSTPGTAQTGNINITGTGILGSLSVNNGATIGSGLTVNAGGLAVTGNSTISGTLGSLTGLSSSGTITFSGVGSGVLQAASGVLSTGAVALGTQTTGSYVANLGTLTGLTTSGNSGAGSTPTLTVAYGSAANTAVQGNTTLNCSSITGTNLTGGGGTVTLGTTGSSCNSIGFTDSPTFSGTVAVQGSNALTLGATGSNTGAILFNGATAASGTLTVIGPANPSTNTLTLPNETGTLCSTASVCSGYAASTGSTNYIQNQNSAPQASANFSISGSGAASTSFIAPTYTSNGAITIAATGASNGVTVKNGANSGTAFQVQAAAGSTAILAVDTNNSKLTVEGSQSTAILGANLITNGTFTADLSGWTAGTGWAWSSGTAQFTGSTLGTLSQNISVTSGQTYQVSFTESSAAGSVAVTLGSANVIGSGAGNTFSGSSTYTRTVVANATGSVALTFAPTSSSFSGSSLTNISVSPVTLSSALPVEQFLNSDGSVGLEVRSGGSGLLNSFIGVNAGQSNTVGTSDTALGASALQSNTTGVLNVAIGTSALQNNTNGNRNTAIGTSALQNNTTGGSDTALGGQALLGNTVGIDNSAVGQNALASVTTGSFNTGLGYQAGYTSTSANATTTGANDTFLGYNAGPGSTLQVSNSTAVGAAATVNASNTVILGCTSGVNGCTSTTNVGINSGGYATNPLTVSSATYNTGTITQSTTTVTGSGTAFTAGMAGGTLYYADGSSTTITSVNAAAQTMVVGASKTISSGQAYTIVYGGFNVSSTGTALLQPATDSATTFVVQNAAGDNTSDTLLGLSAVGNANDLVTNPSFEQNNSGWAAKGNMTISQATGVGAPFGSWALQITNNGTPSLLDGAKYQVNLSSSTAYILSFYAKAASASFSTGAFGRSDTGSGDTACTTTATIGLTWQRFTCAFTTSGSTTAGSSYIFIGQNDTTGRTFYIDGVDLEQQASTGGAFYKEGALNLAGTALGNTLIQPASNSNAAFQVAAVNGTNGLLVDTNGSNLSTSFFTTISASARINTTATSAFRVNNSGSAANLINADTSTVTNIDTNGGIENSAGTATGYAANGTGSAISVDTTANNAYEGSNTLKIVTSGSSITANAGAKYSLTTATFPIGTYSLSFFAKLPSGSSAFTTLAAGYAQDGSTNTNCTLNSTTLTAYWQRYSCTFTTSASSGTPYFFIGQSDTGTAPHTYYVDSVQIFAASAPTTYREGLLQFNGVITSPGAFQNQSDSTSAFQVQNAAGSNNSDTLFGLSTAYNANNLVTNGSFEQNTTGWAASGAAAAISQTTAQSAPYGTNALQITTSGSPVALNGAAYQVNMTNGSTYNLSFYEKSATAFSTLIEGWSNDGTTNQTTGCNAASTSTIAWNRFNCTFTYTGTTNNGVSTIFIGQNDTSTRTWYVDGVSLQLTTGGATTSYYNEGTLNLTGLALGNTLIQPAANSSEAFVVASATGVTGLRVNTGASTISSGFAATFTSTLAVSGATTINNTATITTASANAFLVQASAGNTAVTVNTNNLTSSTDGHTAVMFVTKDATSGRSIDASGLISASGSDYAEWIPWSGTQPPPGSIVTYSGSNYVVSSPNTAGFVGNDNFNASDSILVTFTGQVPVLVTGPVNQGDILVPNGDGTAKAIDPAKATIGELLSKVAIAQATNTDPNVKSVPASVGTTSDSVANTLQNQSGTFSDISVTGTADFANLNASGTATLTNLQVQTVNVTGNLTVTGLTKVQDIQINGHIITAGGQPTAVAQSGSGVGGSCTVAGDDTAGTVTITPSGSGINAGAVCQIDFASPFSKSPRPVIAPTNGPSSVVQAYVSASATGSFTISFNGLPSAQPYTFNWFAPQ